MKTYTLFHEMFRMFFANIISLPGQKVKCFGNNKNVLFLNSNYKIIEQEVNKMAHYPEQPPSSESRSRGLLIVSDDVSVGRNAQLLDVVVEAVQVGKIARNVLGRLDAVVQVEVCCGRNVRSEGRKEMFYLTMHSTHFIYGFMALFI